MEREKKYIAYFCPFLASFDRQEQAASPCQHRLGLGSTPRHMHRKRRPIYRVAPLNASSTKKAAFFQLGALALKVAGAATEESEKKEQCEKQDSSKPNMHPISSDVSVLLPQNDPVRVSNIHSPLNQMREPQALEVICFTVLSLLLIYDSRKIAGLY